MELGYLSSYDNSMVLTGFNTSVQIFKVDNLSGSINSFYLTVL